MSIMQCISQVCINGPPFSIPPHFSYAFPLRHSFSRVSKSFSTRSFLDTMQLATILCAVSALGSAVIAAPPPLVSSADISGSKEHTTALAPETASPSPVAFSIETSKPAKLPSAPSDKQTPSATNVGDIFNPVDQALGLIPQLGNEKESQPGKNKGKGATSGCVIA
ncbi:hypothetical protein B0H19DRAFT_93198 [Mycena capillaripes]|nr:hypothetical protein B0H19DRAFT_93198 [Mycena capillaripes]